MDVDARSALNGQALPLLQRARIVGCLTVAALLLMGVFAGVAHASSVTSVSVTNSVPTDAAGARTVYSISFDTSSTGGLSTAASSTITITLPDRHRAQQRQQLADPRPPAARTSARARLQPEQPRPRPASSSTTKPSPPARNSPSSSAVSPTRRQPQPGGQTSRSRSRPRPTRPRSSGSFPVAANNPITKLSVMNSDADRRDGCADGLLDRRSTRRRPAALSTLAEQRDHDQRSRSGTGLTNVDSSQIHTANGHEHRVVLAATRTPSTATCEFFNN